MIGRHRSEGAGGDAMTETCSYRFDPDDWSAAHDRPSHLSDPWSCPRDAREDADRCLFHLSPDERSERGIDERAVAEALATVARGEGRHAKRIVGATLGDVDLERVVLDGADNHPLDLRHATVSGAFSLGAATVRLPIDLRGARLTAVDWNDASLSGECEFADAVVEGPFDVAGANFEDDVDFEGVRFAGDVTARETRFHADTCLRDTVFEGGAAFDGVEFRGDANLVDDDACFERAVFEAGASFRKARFRYADFVECAFEGDVDFDEVTFAGDAEFADAVFRDRASFRGAAFEGDADVLIDDADFSGAAFGGVAAFDHATFGLGNFGDASFAAEARFDDVAFEDDAAFADAAFEADATFAEARFRRDADFSGVDAAADLVFVGAEFDGGDNVEDDDVSFEGASVAGTADFRSVRARFVNAASLTAGAATFADAVVSGDAVFTGAEFGRLTLDECRFRGDSNFSEVRVDGDCSARGVEFQGRDNVDDDDAAFRDAEFGGEVDFYAAAFRYADFAGATVEGDATFASTDFDDDAAFDGVRVGGAVSFDEARFRDDVAFEGAAFEGAASFDGAEFDGGDNVADDDVSFENASFGDDASFERAQFRYAGFGGVEFAAAACFHEARFERPAEFTGGRFGGETTFEEARFRDDAAFDETVFEADAAFDGAEFDGGDNVEDDDVTFEDATFEATVRFEHVEFEYANFRSLRVDDDATFRESTFRDLSSFADGTFGGAAAFGEVTFEDDTRFADCSVAGDASFFGVEFEGGASEEEDASFTRTAFGGRVDLRETECDDLGLSAATVDGSATFTGSEFGRIEAEETLFRGPVDLSYTRYADRSSFAGVTFEDEATLDEVRFGSDVSFAGADFDAGASFRGAEFVGGAHTIDDADFEAARFGDTADFKLAEFRYADFSGVEFDGTAIFVDATFTDAALFQRTEFASSALFSRTAFNAGAEFSSAAFGDTAHFDEVEFDADSTFADARFDGDATFVASEFHGSRNRHDDDASFQSATFVAEADFDEVSFRYANFAKTAFGDRGSFVGTTFSEAVRFRPVPIEAIGAGEGTESGEAGGSATAGGAAGSAETLVDLTDATVAGGTLGQPEAGSAFYDCTGSEIGRVTFDDAHCDRELFDYFRLCNTDFDGFDFTSHKAHLAENDWVIHEFGAERTADGNGAVTNPATLENTYLKAKNCASDFGDRKAAAEFFIKEMLYRRKKNGYIATGRSVGSVTAASPRTRLNAVGKWIGNTILYQTCGYGERLWRVMYVSFAAILAWGLVYTLMPTGVDGGGARTLESAAQLLTPEGIAVLGRNVYFSTATFITLEYVNGAPGGSMARWLASLEAFTGALLIALVVFVLGRRVAW